MNSLLTSYTYDEIDQLKTENSSSLSNTYNYDNNGNRINRISNAGTDIYTYDFGDKLTGISRTYGAGSTYTYDGCGRTATISGSGGTRIFTWDYEDRLTNLSGGGVPSTNYGYNGAGSRTSKSNTLGSRTYKRNGVGITAPVLSDGVATMVPGISEKSGGVTKASHSDASGSTKNLSVAGTSTDTMNYDAFGCVLSRTGTSPTENGYMGGYSATEDVESGLKNVGGQTYDPNLGRFLTRKNGLGGRSAFSFMQNNPLNFGGNRGLPMFFSGDGDSQSGIGDSGASALAGFGTGILKTPGRIDGDGQWIVGKVEGVGRRGYPTIPNRVIHLDYPHGGSQGNPNYHLNSEYFPKLNHKSVPAGARFLGKAMFWKVGGMIASGAAIAYDAYSIANSDKPMETFCKSVTVWGAAWVGAEIGTAICPGIGTVIGAILFGLATSLIVHSQDDENGYIRTGSELGTSR
ncbi:MAG: hypothetical protein WCI55_08570 [Armatimonadota bacterium]